MKHLSTGYAIQAIDLFYKFNNKLITLKKKDFLKLGIIKKKKRIAERVFTCAFKMILEDVVENNVLFKLPTQSNCTISIRPKPKFAVDKIINTHGLKDINIIKSGFNVYEINLDIYKPRIGKVVPCPIYVGNNLKKKLISNSYKQKY